MRIEEENGRVWFTDHQEEVEKYLNEIVKFRNQVGDLIIRKENGGLPKELRPQSIATLTREEISIRRILKMKEVEEVRLSNEKQIKTEQRNETMPEEGEKKG
jgi:hypothetical protein